MATGTDGLVEVGNAALGKGDWEAARSAFREALARGDPSPGVLIGLADASWWLGDMAGTIEHLEAAYAGARRAGDWAAAAIAALRLAAHYAAHLGHPAAAGWLARAVRLADEHGLESLRGELVAARANFAPDPVAGEALAREALAMARAAGDVDGELMALSLVGNFLVEQGRVADGVAHLDEAMAGCLGGEPESLDTFVFTTCTSMTSCARCADFERAVQWVRAGERFAARHSSPFLFAECRTLYARILFATGEWVQAEETARAAIELSRDSVPVYHADALATLGELRVAQGRTEEAERLVSGFDAHPPVIPVLARIHLARGRPDLARATARRQLDVVATNPLASAVLHEVVGEAEIALGEVDRALERGRALAALGETVDCAIIGARGDRLVGRAVAATDTESARRHLDRSLAVFVRLGLPYEVALTRLALAEVVQDDDGALAVVDARAALEGFDRLGATAGANAASALLRSLGVPASRSASRGPGLLTVREREVFALLGEGASNPEIAARLFVSRKTVEHHVSAILAKLGLRNRAEAAAEAVRLRGRAEPVAPPARTMRRGMGELPDALLAPAFHAARTSRHPLGVRSEPRSDAMTIEQEAPALPAAPGDAPFDPLRAEAFAEQMLGVVTGGMLSLLASVGHRTGLFDALAGLAPSSSAQVAAAAGLDERYVREWLGAMVTGRIVEYDPGRATYALPAEHAAFLTRAAGPDNLAVLAQYVALLAEVEVPITDVFRTGGGLGYEHYPRFHELMAEESERIYEATLLDQTIPMVPGLADRLAAGADAIDIGCGRGVVTRILARRFPASRFTGLDFAPEAIDWARQEAEREGLENAQYVVQDAATFGGPPRFDLVTAFDAVHDQAHPRRVLRGIRKALRPGGVFLMVDIATSSHLENNLDNPFAPALYAVSTLHCMTVSLADGGEGLGTCWGEELAHELLAEAGFAHVTVHHIEKDPMNAYYVCRV